MARHYTTKNKSGDELSVIENTSGGPHRVWEHENGRYLDGEHTSYEAAVDAANEAAKGHTEHGYHS